MGIAGLAEPNSIRVAVNKRYSDAVALVFLLFFLLISN